LKTENSPRQNEGPIRPASIFNSQFSIRNSQFPGCPNAFSALVIVLLAVNYFAPFADLDFTWQIRTGEQILKTGNLKPPESFTYTICGRQVPDFEWLYELVLWAIWTGCGFGGLKLLKTMLVAAPLVLLGLRLRKEGVRCPGIGSATLLAILVLSPAWNLRPMYCTTIGLLLVSGWLRDHCHGRRRLDWRLPLTMLLWANSHPGVIMGQALLLGAIAWEWANRWLKINPPLGRLACRQLTWVGGLGLLATFVGPDPLERLLYPFQPEVAHPIQHIFAEMRPLYTFLLQAPLVAWVVYPVALTIACAVILRFRRYRLWEIALLLGLCGLANLAVRSLQDWFLIMLALGIPQCGVLLRYWRTRSASHPRGERYVLARAVVRMHESCTAVMNSRLLQFQYWPAVAFVFLAVISVIPGLGRQMPVQDARLWPRPALDWMAAHHVGGRFFAPPDYGSYLAWRLGTRARTYVDTRGFFFPHELLEDSHYIPQLGPQWGARLQRVFAYGTDYFLLETTGARGRLWQALRSEVGNPLYLDEQSVLLSASQVRTALAQTESTGKVTSVPAQVAADLP
jgi:hypothetical protein